jgi:hypothetical protein
MANEFKCVNVWAATKSRMDEAKLCPDESYDSLINRLLDERKKLEA